MNNPLLKIVYLVWGRKAALSGTLLFIPAGLTIAYMALDPNHTQTLAAGMASAWIVAALTSYWALDELLLEESASGALQLYILTGKEFRLFWESVLAGALLTFIVWLVCLFFAALLFDFQFGIWLSLMPAGAIYALGTAAILVVTRLVAKAAGAGALLGPLLCFPLQAPILLSSLRYSHALLTQTDGQKWMLLGLFFGILYLLLGQWATPQIVKE